MTVHYVVTGLDALATDLKAAIVKAPAKTRAAIEVTAFKVKADARSRAEGIGPHAKHYPRSITYDVHQSFGSVYAEVGPDKSGPQGALGNLLEFGSVNNAPSPHLGPALEANIADFERGIELATDGLL